MALTMSSTFPYQPSLSLEPSRTFFSVWLNSCRTALCFCDLPTSADYCRFCSFWKSWAAFSRYFSVPRISSPLKLLLRLLIFYRTILENINSSYHHTDGLSGMKDRPWKMVINRHQCRPVLRGCWRGGLCWWRSYLPLYAATWLQKGIWSEDSDHPCLSTWNWAMSLTPPVSCLSENTLPCLFPPTAAATCAHAPFRSRFCWCMFCRRSSHA